MKRALRSAGIVGIGFCLIGSTLLAQERADSVATDATAIPAAAKKPQILNFDKVPRGQWIVDTCNGPGTATASHGILTIDSPDQGCYEWINISPDSVWAKYVDDENRGYVLEASIKVDPSTTPECDDRGAVQMWAGDIFKTIIVGISNNEICLAYPEMVQYAINTTDSFHIYRVESRGLKVRIYVDGQLKIDHTIVNNIGAGSGTILTIGDGTGANASLTQWDYFSYDVFP